ncbi:MAG TPA: dihydrofolate reductase family protein [Candidatus Stackebrandtia excrementipullorum]|nr:dihydrofolate reductase family protein [Candidatus Stackebrandtia excrementipullorum]
MRNLVYYVALSIDGFIAGPNDEVDFYPTSPEYMEWMITEFPDTVPSHLRSAVGIEEAPNRCFDTVLMGRRTYEGPARKEGVTNPYRHLRQYVFSRTMEQLDPAVETVTTDPVAKVRELKREDSAADIYLAGGGILAGTLVDEIDRLVIKKYPVVAGAGVPAFGSTFRPTRFDLTDVKTFDGGNTVMYYDRTTGS